MFGVKEQSINLRSLHVVRSALATVRLQSRIAAAICQVCEKTSCTRIRRLDAEPTTRVSDGAGSLATAPNSVAAAASFDAAAAALGIENTITFEELSVGPVFFPGSSIRRYPNWN
jgi:hypothetical protein